MVMAVTQPVWSLVDEAQHFDFIAQLSHGRYPVADSTLISQETMDVTQRTGVYRAFYPPGTYPIPDLTDIGLPPPGMSDRANAVWMQRHMWQLSRESQQTPGYYVAMVPAWWLAHSLGGAFAAVYALRIANALILATLAPMAIVVARMLMPARPMVAMLAALFTILLPGLDLNLTRISNDTLAAAIGGLVVLLAIRWVGSAWPWRRAALIGLLIGAGLVVKLTLAGLFPVLAMSALWPARGTTLSSRIVRMALAGAIAILCLVPWFVLNLHSYGGLFPGARAARLSDAVPMPLTAAFIPLDVAVFVLTYWSGEPWGTLPFSGALAILGGLIALMAPAGIIKVLRARSAELPVGPLAVAVVSVAVAIAVTLALPATFSFEFVAPGRYAYPVLPAAASLCAIGICTVFTSALAQRAIAVYGVVAIAMLAAGALGLPPAPQPGAGTPPPDAKEVGVKSTGQFSGLTVSVDRVALDSHGGATWFHVTAANSGRDEIEWTVPPLASTADGEVKGEYLRSTRIPGDIDPGQTLAGWVWVPIDPSRLDTTRPVTLRFGDVAPDIYAVIGHIDLQVRLDGS